jgi:hypothetical protein
VYAYARVCACVCVCAACCITTSEAQRFYCLLACIGVHMLKI